ncbi:MAG TPA: recombination-associated protein RdgC [Deltaproteobacteria bacterium]|nr:recombination-associated protein RdgC [Deltaproteobacteria bacterium]HPP79957.1 recombination-associated protein RdgC [Deltaproteobacteria bacterium]
MGILSNTVSVYQYTVRGGARSLDIGWVKERLTRNSFVPIDTTADEESTGWVTLDDHSVSDFDNENAFWREPYLAFTLRRDQRKVPAPALRAAFERECARWLEERPGYTRVPAKRKIEIRETLHASLLSKTLAVPTTWDVVWNTETGILTAGAVSVKVLDLVEDRFHRTFDGLLLEPVHPMARARSLLSEDMLALLEREDKASSDDVLLQIKKNRWVGWEFLLWLTERTARGAQTYEVGRDGPLDAGERFSAYVHDRFVLASEHEEGRRTTSITGPQREFSEVRQALLGGKNITDALVYLEKEERVWRLVLRSDIFSFSSFACPVARLERDDTVDPVQERIALFYERMSLLETGIQLFDSVYKTFIGERLSKAWPETRRRIDAWLSSTGLAGR